jgi:virulence-associated protein VagC
VVVDDSGDEIVIITNDARIVIRPAGKRQDRADHNKKN